MIQPRPPNSSRPPGATRLDDNFYWTDANDDLIIDDSEIGELYRIGGSPGTPSANRVDPAFDPFETDELVLGIEHALRPELVIGQFRSGLPDHLSRSS